MPLPGESTPEKKSGTHCNGWDLGLVWTAAENLVQAGIQSPDSPACNESLFLCREYGSQEDRGEDRKKSDRNILHRQGSKFAFQIKLSLTHTHTHTHTRARTRARARPHARIRTHTDTHMHAHTSTHMHTHTHACNAHPRTCTPT